MGKSTLTKQHKRKKEKKAHSGLSFSSFAGFSSPHAVPLMVSELSIELVQAIIMV